MKLHLHLGAHKTGTTHFQEVLKVNSGLYDSRVSYIEMEEFRRNLQWKNDWVDFASCGPYLDKIKGSNSTLLISEENLTGETKDIYRDLFLYSNLEKRVGSFRKFTEDFGDIEVWFSIRSMDGFLPSIYCESLRHWKYKKFNKVYGNNLNQSWLPVIKRIRHIFPKARINVIRYENYMMVLPEVVNRIFGDNEQWDYLKEERPRASMNHYACGLMSNIGPYIPASISPRLLQGLSNFLDDFGVGHKFSPFNKKQIDDFSNLYKKDINAIKQLEQVFVY
jgi:hypothetical protein